MVVGSAIVALCLLVLGWTTEIVSLFVKDAEKVCLFYLGRVLASVATQCSLQSVKKCHHSPCRPQYLCSRLCD